MQVRLYRGSKFKKTYFWLGLVTRSCCMLSDVCFFACYTFKTLTLLPAFLLPSTSPLFDWLVCVWLSLDATIETNASANSRAYDSRDIRLRTEARLAQLREVVQENEQEIAKESDEEDCEDEGPPPCEVCLRRQVQWLVCVRLFYFLLSLLSLHSLNLLYHASEKKHKTI